MNLNRLALQRISKLESGTSGIIRFPNVFYKLCSSFQMSKKDAWKLIFQLRKDGSIDIIPYQGIKIKKYTN